MSGDLFHYLQVKESLFKARHIWLLGIMHFCLSFCVFDVQRRGALFEMSSRCCSRFGVDVGKWGLGGGWRHPSSHAP